MITQKKNISQIFSHTQVKFFPMFFKVFTRSWGDWKEILCSFLCFFSLNAHTQDTKQIWAAALVVLLPTATGSCRT